MNYRDPIRSPPSINPSIILKYKVGSKEIKTKHLYLKKSKEMSHFGNVVTFTGYQHT